MQSMTSLQVIKSAVANAEFNHGLDASKLAIGATKSMQ